MIDLTRFCGPKDERPCLAVPHPVPGGAVASNGHILILVDGAEVAQPNEAERLTESIAANVAKMLDQARLHDFADAIPAMSLSLDNYEECTRCDGNGYVKEVPCQDCDGEGQFMRGRHEYTCQQCDGSGVETFWDAEQTRCPECGGSQVEQDAVKFGANATHGINTKYLHLLQSLPECVVSWATDEWIVYRFTGGCGVVAAMRWRK